MGSRIALAGVITSMMALQPARASAQPPVYAQDFIPDARSQAMGGAFTAVAEGPSAIWWNPGALGLEQPLSFCPFSSAQLLPEFASDVRVHTFGGTGQVAGGSIGFGAHLSRLSYGTVLDLNGQPIVGFEPSESVLLIGVGGNLVGPTRDEIDRFRWGLGTNLKIFDTSYTPSGPSSDGDAFDIDVGTLLAYRLPIGPVSADERERQPSVDFRGGFVVLNLLGHEITYEGEDDMSDPLVRRLRLGGAVELKVPPLPPLHHFDHLLKAILSADRLSFHGEGGDFDATKHVGLEVSAMSLLALRTGYVSDPDPALSHWNWGWGAGADLRIDRGTRLGGRVDFAHTPRPFGGDVEQYTVSGWVTF